jgi:AhpD family alkylhydroperoxidase
MEPRITFEELPDGLYPLLRNIEGYLKKNISHQLSGLIKTRASQLNSCGYCLDMHHKDAIKAGETFQRLYLLPAWKESPVFNDAEKAALQLTDVLTKIDETEPEAIEEAYAVMTKHYSKQEIANIVLAICQINSWNRLTRTLGSVPGTYQN